MDTGAIISPDTPAPAAASSSPWLTIANAAAYAKVSTDVLYSAAERNELRHVRIGGRRSIRLRVDWLDAWLEQHARGATAQPSAGHSDPRPVPLRAVTEARSLPHRSPPATSTGPAGAESAAPSSRDHAAPLRPSATPTRDELEALATAMHTPPADDGGTVSLATQQAQPQPARTGVDRARQLRGRG